MPQILQNQGKPSAIDASSLVDKEIATLEKVLNPKVLGKELTLLRNSRLRWGAFQDVNFRALKWHKGKRCTLELSLRTDGGPHVLIAKVYAKDRPDVHRAMDGLWHTRFGPSEQFSVPEPLGYVIPLRLLLEEKIEGTTAKEAFLKGDEKDRAEAAERSARWLAYFQECTPRSDKISRLDEELNRMERWSRRFTEVGGLLFDKSKLLFEQLAKTASGLGRVEPAAGHGSFSPDHVFFAGDRTVTIDWDGYDAGDPARDVARFIVSTQRLAVGRMGSITALDTAVAAFLKTYTEARGPAILPRLPFYRAATCLRLVKYGVFHHRVPHWEEKVTAMLREGLRVLEA
ncbi:MAG: hypothetical protein DMG36_22380 [Acidobacteria bacterium]|nr:MAG: hypothetical protein DMG36_22380 [Acidobacteriota bacterium]